MAVFTAAAFMVVGSTAAAFTAEAADTIADRRQRRGV
jgi:hypothetical protein